MLKLWQNTTLEIEGTELELHTDRPSQSKANKKNHQFITDQMSKVFKFKTKVKENP